MAVDDDILLKNPFAFKLQDVIMNGSKKREVITIEQQECFLQFIREDKLYHRYYDVIYILFYTGLRISEFCGLTLADIDIIELIRPKITPHICRHTYYTNMARAGINPKSLQYLMGHAEVATTMDVYTHLGYEEAKKEMGRVSDKMDAS